MLNDDDADAKTIWIMARRLFEESHKQFQGAHLFWQQNLNSLTFTEQLILFAEALEQEKLAIEKHQAAIELHKRAIDLKSV